MAELFWQRRVKRRARKILISLPDLPSDIDDNVFIALGTQAAEADKTSKAYDEFLFSEEGYEQMPYEDGIDEILNLQKSRTPERQGRAELPVRMRIQYITKLLESRVRDVEDAKAKVEELSGQVKQEHTYLSGSVKGEENGNWEGVAPDTTSRRKHVTNVLKEWLVFVLVAGADATVVYFSIYSIMPRVAEALMFSAPAIGVQLLFPHLTGKAIANYRANKESNAQDFWIALGIGVSWFAYVLAMSILRFQLLQANYAASHKKAPDMPILLQFAAGMFTFLILIGLGTWVLTRAMKVNPHKHKVGRLIYVQYGAEDKLRKAEKKLAKTQSLLKQEEDLLAEISRQWELRSNSYAQLSESSKAVYRRALVNQLGTPEFTTEYLPEEKFKLKGKQKKKNEF
jgi:hypothetical protein